MGDHYLCFLAIGMFGICNTYDITVEVQGSFTLLGHYLVWMEVLDNIRDLLSWGLMKMARACDEICGYSLRLC